MEECYLAVDDFGSEKVFDKIPKWCNIQLNWYVGEDNNRDYGEDLIDGSLKSISGFEKKSGHYYIKVNRSDYLKHIFND